MPYQSTLEARLARKATRAIKTFDLIEDGDRVMVGLSGGKDSWALLSLLDALRRRAPIRFSLVAVNVDSGYAAYKHDVISRTCEARGWEYRIEHTSIGDIMDDVLDADATPCSLCARLRRGVLYRLASEVGATKIALGHHADDFVETLLLNLFFAGSLKAMPARLLSDDRRHVVIRPLVYVSEDEARAYTRERGLEVIGCCCPVCGDLSLKRQRIKRWLLDLEREHAGIKQSMLRALGNVAPRHLLDTRLNPPAELRAEVAEAAAPMRGGGGRALTAERFRAAATAMRAVIQRVRSASVTVDGEVVGRIARGVVVLVGIGRDDGAGDVAYVARKVRDLRLFEDEAGRLNRSLAEVGGAALVVSQFTLYGDCRRGRRPSFDAAAAPPEARAVYEALVGALRGAGTRVETGVFRAMMDVALVNEGPVTVLLDSTRMF